MPKFLLNQKVVSEKYRECPTLRYFSDQIFTVVVSPDNVCMTIETQEGNKYRVKAKNWRIALDSEVEANAISGSKDFELYWSKKANN